jgi:hypothetical protein
MKFSNFFRAALFLPPIASLFSMLFYVAGVRFEPFLTLASHFFAFAIPYVPFMIFTFCLSFFVTEKSLRIGSVFLPIVFCLLEVFYSQWAGYSVILSDVLYVLVTGVSYVAIFWTVWGLIWIFHESQ